MERFGFLLVYLGAAYGVVAAAWAVMSLIRPTEQTETDPATSTAGRNLLDTAIDILALAGAAVATGSLWVTWIEGWTPERDFVQQNAWVALDPVSTCLSSALGALVAALVLRNRSRSYPLVLISVCVSLAFLVDGNVLIQANTSRGSHLRYGGYTAAVGTVLLVLAGIATLLNLRSTRWWKDHL